MVASRSWLCLPSTSSTKPVAASSSTSPPISHHCRLPRRQSKGSSSMYKCPDAHRPRAPSALQVCRSSSSCPSACSTCSCMQIQYGILQINQHDTECFKFSIGYEDANPELKSEELNARVQAHVQYAASISMRLGGDEDDVGRSKAWQR